MNADTPWLREQIIAVLTTDGVLSTDDVARRLPPEHMEHPCRVGNVFGCRESSNARKLNFSCRDGVHRFDFVRSANEVYRHLRALESKGLVHRMKLGNYDRRVFWGRVDYHQVADEIEMLESMLARS